MGNFCIMRTKKLTSDGNVVSSLQHALRERETPNADACITNWTTTNKKDKDGNTYVPSNAFDVAMAEYRKRLPVKQRKNGVKAIEMVMTISPEVMEKKGFNARKYLNDCDNWARETFGADNIFFISHHYDEKTPHTSLFLVPKEQKTYKDGHVEDVLNAKKWLGGREKLQKLQTSFYETVGKKHDLDRGIEGSNATHDTVKTYYSKLNKLDKQIDGAIQTTFDTMPEKGFFESKDDYEERQKEHLKKSLKPLTESIIMANEQKKKYQQLQTTFRKNLADQVQTKLNNVLDEEVSRAVEPYKNSLTKAKNQIETLEKQVSDYKAFLYEGCTFEHDETGKKVNADKGLIHLGSVADNWRHFSPEQLRGLATKMDNARVNNAVELKEFEDKQAQKKSRSSGYSR